MGFNSGFKGLKYHLLHGDEEERLLTGEMCFLLHRLILF